MNKIVTYIFLAFSALAAAACSDPVADVEGGFRITADKSRILADGNEEVTFTVMFEGEDISTDGGLQLIRIFDGSEKYMAYGVNKFSTVVPGTYRFKAEYYYAGRHVTDNEVKIVADQFFSGEEKNYARRYFGTLFTSVGCVYCPRSSEGLKELQQSRPGEISIASFHADYTVRDPMTIPETKAFNDALGAKGGLPNFFWNMNEDAYVGGVANALLYGDSLDKEKESYQTVSGVAIDTKFDEASSRLDIEFGITSNIPAVFRYLVLLVEDNIPAEGEYAQNSDDNLVDYKHDNVVRDVLTAASGAKINSDLPLQVGVEVRESESVVLDKGWKPENMRVIVAAMTSSDGGFNWTVNNVNECKLGESVGYQYAE